MLISKSGRKCTIFAVQTDQLQKGRCTVVFHYRYSKMCICRKLMIFFLLAKHSQHSWLLGCIATVPILPAHLCCFQAISSDTCKGPLMGLLNSGFQCPPQPAEPTLHTPPLPTPLAFGEGTQLCMPPPLLQGRASWCGMPLPFTLTYGRGWPAHGRSRCGCWGSPAPPGSCGTKAVGLGDAAGCGATVALQGWGIAGLTGTAAGVGSQIGWGRSLSGDCRRCSWKETRCCCSSPWMHSRELEVRARGCVPGSSSELPTPGQRTVLMQGSSVPYSQLLQGSQAMEQRWWELIQPIQGQVTTWSRAALRKAVGHSHE